ncbi:unnamed protein product, partial [Didymodactylos carnosus]
GNTSFGCTQNQLNFPIAIYIDSTTDILHIVDTNNNHVQQLLLNGSSSEITTIAAGGINCTLAKDRIELWLNKEKSDVTVAGNGSFGSELNEISFPQGLWTHQSTMFVVDRYNHRVTKWTLQPSATDQVVAGGNGQGNSNNQLNYPQGFYVDKTANDKEGNNSLEGITIAGTTGKGGNAANQLYIPESITFDSQMNMYIADSGNHRIQKFQRIL